VSDIKAVAAAARTDIGYTCEGCNETYPSYRAMMLCEEADFADTVAARKGHVSPRVMRPVARWDED
jgi:hypothetical protein